MPNDWFQFKQFKIYQDKCAMKVSTDACILGAWAANEFAKIGKPDATVLDIGTGTGLLTLMIAQALPDAQFDAIEINEDAFQQAVRNFADSNWDQRIKSYHTSLSDYSTQEHVSANYDFIICNPPFFHNHLESTEKARNDARHGQSLSKNELAETISTLLKKEGLLCVMYPISEWESWLKIAKRNGLHLKKQIIIKPRELSNPNRMSGILMKEEHISIEERTLFIYDSEKNYTPEIQCLLENYYLAF